MMKNKINFDIKKLIYFSSGAASHLQEFKNFVILCNHKADFGIDAELMPHVLQKRMLKEFHMGYSGICRMRPLMRSYIYWPKNEPGQRKWLGSVKLVN